MINKLFTIEWVGPFQDIESLINWEKNIIQNQTIIFIL